MQPFTMSMSTSTIPTSSAARPGASPSGPIMPRAMCQGMRPAPTTAMLHERRWTRPIKGTRNEGQKAEASEIGTKVVSRVDGRITAGKRRTRGCRTQCLGQMDSSRNSDQDGNRYEEQESSSRVKRKDRSMITTRLLAGIAAQGDPDAQFRLAYRLAFGRGSNRPDWRKAAQYWRRAARSGHVRAQFYLGTCYEDGHGVRSNVSRAIQWYLKAAHQGHEVAQYNIAFSYLHGQGLRRSPAKAVKWYRLSALQGDADAQRDLGYCYYEGLGVARDFKRAVHWYRLAASQGDAKAQFNLGLCFQWGEGVRRSWRWAQYWLQKAAFQRHKGAIEVLCRHAQQTQP